MSMVAIAALCAAALAASDPPSDAPTRDSEKDAAERALKALQDAAPGLPTGKGGKPQLRFEPASKPLPQMRWDADIYCGEFAPTASVPSGQFRLQCADNQCLVAPSRVLDPSGVETDEELSRAQVCTPRNDWDHIIASGYKFIPAIGEVQPGWVRDERGRAMQYNFDMNRRAWLGASYAPLFSQLDSGHQRMRAEIGVEVESPSEDGHALYRWHALESQLYIGATPTYDATLVRLDWSTSRNKPILFLTTFFGDPARHDLYMDLGGWFEAFHLEYLKRGGEVGSYLTWGAANATLDLWHSKDLASYLRLRAGPAVEFDTIHQSNWLKPEGALEFDWTIDNDGFHHIRAQGEYEKLLLGTAVPGRAAADPERFRVSAEYEVIVVAINDQPVTLVLGGKGVWRNDFVTVGPGFEATAEAGIRFSLWAPARRSAPLQRTH